SPPAPRTAGTSGAAASTAPDDGPDSGPETAAGPGTEVVVHVAGAVARPGIVRLPAGARVFEAVAAAGGTAKDADESALNLAAPVEDGQQIFVPSPEHPAPARQPEAAGPEPGTGPEAAAPGARKVNVNTAGAEELMTLPRIGPVLARRIIDFRQQHGAFTRPEDLDAVPGIGPGLLEALLDLVAV
ncbi:helix-hairpin-helix domain-containing protein, partial [Arthrobacter sp. GCM10027362]|uniref:ComEA family DNA-binding protein n=1 Tax=Arthrobacter sp. GCM10027362 TaxID=3273379 RepID=UPI00363DC0AF